MDALIINIIDYIIKLHTIPIYFSEFNYPHSLFIITQRLLSCQ